MKSKRKNNIKQLEQYSQVILTQPLAHNKEVTQTCTKEKDSKWKVTYESNSIHHICPYDGMFRKCEECGGLEEDFDISYCLKKQEFVSSAALCERIKDCEKAELEVCYIY